MKYANIVVSRKPHALADIAEQGMTPQRAAPIHLETRDDRLTGTMLAQEALALEMLRGVPEIIQKIEATLDLLEKNQIVDKENSKEIIINFSPLYDRESTSSYQYSSLLILPLIMLTGHLYT